MSTSPPPRKLVSSSSCKAFQRHANQSALQILLQMGISKNRAEKALAATGQRGPQLATDWLLAHVNDPTLDEYQPREYILYLCPTETLANQIDDFFAKSLQKCGWNAVHNHLPHITLCSFFQAPDNYVGQMVNDLQVCVEKIGVNLPAKISLKSYVSSKFIGLFVSDEDNYILKRLVTMFMRGCSDFARSEVTPMHVIKTCFPWCSSYQAFTGDQIQVEPYLNQLHLSLSCKFAEKDRPHLEKLLTRINLNAQCTWEIRLYSKDQRSNESDVYKVINQYLPRQPDELELIVGDYIYVNRGLIDQGKDQWIDGISWLTGCSGLFPVSYVVRSAESDAWTLHKCIPLGSSSFECHNQISIPFYIDPQRLVEASSPELIFSNEKKRKLIHMQIENDTLDNYNEMNLTLKDPQTGSEFFELDSLVFGECYCPPNVNCIRISELILRQSSSANDVRVRIEPRLCQCSQCSNFDFESFILDLSDDLLALIDRDYQPDKLESPTKRALILRSPITTDCNGSLLVISHNETKEIFHSSTLNVEKCTDQIMQTFKLSVTCP